MYGMSEGDKSYEEKVAESAGAGSMCGCHLNSLPEGKSSFKKQYVSKDLEG